MTTMSEVPADPIPGVAQSVLKRSSAQEIGITGPEFAKIIRKGTYLPGSGMRLREMRMPWSGRSVSQPRRL
jgi:hypothetical protein